MTFGLYTGFILLIAFQRLLELRLSKRNAELLLVRGGVEHGRGHYAAMVAFHAAFLASCLLEVWILRRPYIPRVGAPAFVVFFAAQLLRSWSIASLGNRWCTRVIVLPRTPLVAHGPYRFLRHPNYLAVTLEIAAIPLAHSAWITAAVFSALNAALLLVRIRVENRALREVAS
jgi:methyltransferase